MKLEQLLRDIPEDMLVSRQCKTDPRIRDLAYDSRRVGEGALFFAIEGLTADGHQFLDQVRSRGAVAVASERPAPEDDWPPCWLQVRSIRKFMAICASAITKHPSRRLRLVGVTGTNGKTTTAYLIHQIMCLREPALMMGTIQTDVGGKRDDALLTTPESVDIQKTLASAVASGCKEGVLEVSSHALHFNRVFQCHFPVAVFTNLSQDHLDFHSSLEEYFSAKSRLFQKDFNPGLEVALLNGDDPFGSRLADRTPGSLTFGISPENDIHPHHFRSAVAGIELEVARPGSRFRLRSSLVGKHNVYNILAAAAASLSLGYSESEIAAGVETLQAVPGRFEKVEIDRPFTVVIDFAHTPDALTNLLGLAREVTPGRIICLFGCGGDRDRAKRPRMGKIAASLSDLVVVTSDNPRSEAPNAIIEEILTGIPADARNRIEVIEDRREAIGRALQMARPDDLVLLAGKGHERYQEVKGLKRPFDEREIVREALC